MNGKIEDYNDNIWRTRFHYQYTIEFIQVPKSISEIHLQIVIQFKKRYKALEAIFKES